MPFQSKAQRGWMFANLKDVAREWAHKYGYAVQAHKKKEEGKKKA